MSLRSWLMLVLLFAWSGCKTAGLVGGVCLSGLQACDGTCVDIAKDEANCGSCGHVCAEDKQCRVGLCRSRPEPVPTSTAAPTGLADAGPALADGGAVSPQASFSSTASMSQSSAAPSATLTSTVPDAGGTDPCIPPYESAEQCGACDIACGPAAPFCGDLGSGYQCLTGCPSNLDLCADRCVDVNVDEWNCGGCGNTCPTGICRSAQCVGSHAGHFVAICSNYTRPIAMSPQSVLLGNALFLSTMSRVRLLMLETFASATTRRGIRDVLTAAETTHSGSIDLSIAASEADVSARLNARDFDVFLLADPVAATADALRTMGADLAPVLQDFIATGGTLVVLNGSGTPQISEFLGSSGAALLDVRGVLDVTFLELFNRAPADGLASGVLSPFLGLNTSCVYDTDAGNSPDTNVVITGIVAGENTERPSVFHRVVLPQ